ncbi:MAG TPA: SCP2 sterol-binding domain-containing protein [Acidimicrobiales bacterium]|jgi:hypothetical protein|nr:SCP2 sterol-binding domain-containing protein [Acidimicrobiales bacterium]
MARFLSAEWFASVTSAGPPTATVVTAADGPPTESPESPGLVIEQVVTATPDGTVVYRIAVAGGQARIVWPVPPDAPPADLRISSEWATAVAVAQGQLSAQRALMQGRLRVSGRPGGLSAPAPAIDPVPAEVRSATTYE